MLKIHMQIDQYDVKKKKKGNERNCYL